MTRRPTPIADVLADLITRHGFARVCSTEALERAWKRAVAPLEAGDLIVEHTRVGKLNRGRLEVTVDHSTLLHELDYNKAELLNGLREQLPREAIKDLRFRLGTVQ